MFASTAGIALTALSAQLFVESIYKNLLNKTLADDTAGITAWVKQITDGNSTADVKAAVVASIVSAIADHGPNGKTPGDAKTLLAVKQFNNKVLVSDSVSDKILVAPSDAATSLGFSGTGTGNNGTGTGDLLVTDTAASVTAANALVAQLPTGVAGTTFTLTTASDNGAGFTGTGNDDIFDASGFFNAGTGTVIQTLAANDSIDGGLGKDTLNVLLNTVGGITTGPIKLASMEVINLTNSVSANILNLANATGVTTLNSVNTGNNIAQFNNVQSAATNYGVSNSNLGLTANIVNTALAGTANTATVTVSSMTGGTITLQTVTAASGYETVNLVSNGTTLNNMVLTDGISTSLATINVTGGAALTLGALDATVLTIDGSAATGVMTLNVTANAVKSNIKTGTANDVIDISTRFVDGTTAATVDIIDGGEGVNRLNLTSAEAALVTSAAQFSNVTNIQTISLDTDANASNMSLINLGGADTLRFDNLVGAHTITAASGNEIEFNFADTGTDARNYNIGGTATTDTLTFDINGVDLGNGLQTLSGIENAIFTVSGTSLLDGAITMTPTAAQEVLTVTGSGPFTTGNITTDVLDLSGYSGTFITGVLQQGTNVKGGSGSDTVVGSVAADIFAGNDGSDIFTNTAAGANVSAGDVISGGGGFDQFNFHGDTASALVSTILATTSTVGDLTVGTTAASSDIIGIDATEASYTNATTVVQGTGGAITIQTVGQNAATTGLTAAIDLFKLTTATTTTGTLQAAFDVD